MTRKQETSIRIRRISIQDYKGIDNLDMEFPPPRLPDEPDIFVLGSSNGLGKTSVIECCALLLLGPALEPILRHSRERFSSKGRHPTVDVPDLMIRADAKEARIDGEIALKGDIATAHLRINRDGEVNLSGGKTFEKILKKGWPDPESGTDHLIRAICGFTPNPVIEETFLLFHSYRKVQEGNPEIGEMVDERGIRRSFVMGSRYEFPRSTFKLQMLRSLMAQADLFEARDPKEGGETIDFLNELMKTYAGGTVSKLRPSRDNTIDFRVDSVRGGGSFTFDGLSSGQKEIISTLFLIWYHTRNSPSTVFIDEPELHLNAQWHRRFVKSLTGLAPQNQYILATHSEGVMDSVRKDRRALLSSG